MEAIIRISEAFCRMRLGDYVTTADIDRAIGVTIESFVGSQKVACKKALARAFAKYTLAKPKPSAGQRRGGGAASRAGRTATVAA